MVVVPTEQNGDLALVGGVRGSRESFPFGGGWEGELRSIIQVLFNG